MPKLIYSVDLSKPPLEIVARALTIVRVQAYAQKKGLSIEEQSEWSRRQFLLLIPLDELNAVLDELLFAGLLNPIQEILSRPSAHTILHERFSTLTWIDAED
jgi:ABC-type uncharacterized transport system permease subunit